MCMLSNDIYDYYNVSQGKITIPNVDDGEECVLTDVSVIIDHDISSDPLEMLKKLWTSQNSVIPPLYAIYILAGYIFRFYDR